MSRSSLFSTASTKHPRQNNQTHVAQPISPPETDMESSFLLASDIHTTPVQNHRSEIGSVRTASRRQPSIFYKQSEVHSPYTRGPETRRPAMTRWLVVVMPPAILDIDEHEGESSSVSPSRFSAGLLMPLYPTMYGQLAAIAKEFSLPSTTGLRTYLQIPEGGNFAAPRITDESWTMLFSHFFVPDGSTPTFPPHQLPIGGRIEFDIDTRTAKWFSAWVRGKANAPSTTTSNPLYPESLTTHPVDGPEDEEGSDLPGTARPSHPVPQHMRQLSLLERRVKRERPSLPSLSRAPSAAHTSMDRSQLAAVVHSPGFNSLSPPTPNDLPGPSLAASSKHIDNLVRNWRLRTPTAAAPPPETTMPPSPSRLQSQSPTESLLDLNDFAFSISSAGPRSYVIESEDEDGFSIVLSMDLGHRGAGSVVMTPTTATSWGPPSIEGSIYSNASRYPSPDIGARMLEDAPPTPSTATSWGPTDYEIDYEEEVLRFWEQRGYYPSPDLATRMLDDVPNTPSTATSWGPDDHELDYEPLSPVRGERTPDVADRMHSPTMPTLLRFGPDSPVLFQHMWPYQSQKETDVLHTSTTTSTYLYPNLVIYPPVTSSISKAPSTVSSYVYPNIVIYPAVSGSSASVRSKVAPRSLAINVPTPAATISTAAATLPTPAATLPNPTPPASPPSTQTKISQYPFVWPYIQSPPAPQHSFDIQPVTQYPFVWPYIQPVAQVAQYNFVWPYIKFDQKILEPQSQEEPHSQYPFVWPYNQVDYTSKWEAQSNGSRSAPQTRAAPASRALNVVESVLTVKKPSAKVNLPREYPNLVIYPAVYPVLDIYPAMPTHQPAELSAATHNAIIHVSSPKVSPQPQAVSKLRATTVQTSSGYVPVKLASRYPNIELYTAVYPYNLNSLYPSATPVPRKPTASQQPVTQAIAAKVVPSLLQAKLPAPTSKRAITITLSTAYPHFNIYPAAYPSLLIYPPRAAEPALAVSSLAAKPAVAATLSQHAPSPLHTLRQRRTHAELHRIVFPDDSRSFPGDIISITPRRHRTHSELHRLVIDNDPAMTRAIESRDPETQESAYAAYESQESYEESGLYMQASTPSRSPSPSRSRSRSPSSSPYQRGYDDDERDEHEERTDKAFGDLMFAMGGEPAHAGLGLSAPHSSASRGLPVSAVSTMGESAFGGLSPSVDLGSAFVMEDRRFEDPLAFDSRLEREYDDDEDYEEREGSVYSGQEVEILPSSSMADEFEFEDMRQRYAEEEEERRGDGGRPVPRARTSVEEFPMEEPFYGDGEDGYSDSDVEGAYGQDEIRRSVEYDLPEMSVGSPHGDDEEEYEDDDDDPFGFEQYSVLPQYSALRPPPAPVSVPVVPSPEPEPKPKPQAATPGVGQGLALSPTPRATFPPPAALSPPPPSTLPPLPPMPSVLERSRSFGQTVVSAGIVRGPRARSSTVSKPADANTYERPSGAAVSGIRTVPKDVLEEEEED